MTAIPETTQYFPREGRTPPARLQLVKPNPFEEERTTCQPSLTWKDILHMRGELPAPKAKRAKDQKATPVPVAPWNRKGFKWEIDDSPDGVRARTVRECQEGMERIRATPKNIAALLKTSEWKGAKIVGTVASPEIGKAEHAVSGAAGRVAESERHVSDLSERLADEILTDKVRKTLEINMDTARASLAQRQKSLEDARKHLDHLRSEEWIHVVHPSGAEVKIRPQWGE